MACGGDAGVVEREEVKGRLVEWKGGKDSRGDVLPCYSVLRRGQM